MKLTQNSARWVESAEYTGKESYVVYSRSNQQKEPYESGYIKVSDNAALLQSQKLPGEKAKAKRWVPNCCTKKRASKKHCWGWVINDSP